MKHIALWAMLLLASPGLAYSYCEDHPGIVTELKTSKFVVVGKVTRRMIVVDPADDPEGYEAEIFNIEISEVIKGHPPKDMYILSTNTTARFPMEVGTEYFLFIRLDGEGYWVDNCGNSKELSLSTDELATAHRLLSVKQRKSSTSGKSKKTQQRR